MAKRLLNCRRTRASNPSLEGPEASGERPGSRSAKWSVEAYAPAKADLLMRNHGRHFGQRHSELHAFGHALSMHVAPMHFGDLSNDEEA